MSFGAGCIGVNMQFTEISAERLMGFHIQRLIPKEQNLVLSQRLMQLVDLTVTERRRQRDAFNFGADARCHRRDVDGFVAHGATFRSAQINRSRVRSKGHGMPGQKLPLYPKKGV